MLRRHGLTVFTFLSLALSACQEREAPLSLAGHVRALDRTCDPPKNHAQVLRMIARTPIEGDDFNCRVDDDCPCGGFCDGTECTARCVTVEHEDYGCYAEGEVCTNYGRCEVPQAPAPEEQLTLATSTSYIEVSEPVADGAFGQASVFVTLTGDGTPPSPPDIHVRGAATLDTTCGPQPGCPAPEIERIAELGVKCDPEATEFSSECTLEAADWVFLPIDPAHPELGTRAQLEVQVQPIAEATAPTWELRLTGDGEVSPEQQIVTVSRRGKDQPRDGRYAGRLVLSRRGPPVAVETPTDPAAPTVAARPADLVLRVTALVKNENVLIVDPSRLLGPSGKLRLGTPGSVTGLTWLSGEEGVLVGKLRAGTREHDLATGHLRARFSIEMPVHDSDRTTLFDGLIDVDRAGAVDAPACGPSNTCATGSGRTCDPELQLCLRGQAFVTTAPEPMNTLAFAAIWAWADAVEDLLEGLGLRRAGDPTTADVMERLQCYKQFQWDPAVSPRDAVLGADIMSKTGDQKCAGSGFSFPNGLPLLNKIDTPSGGVGSEDTVGELLKSCRAELAAVPGGEALGDAKCIGAARVLAAIAQGLGVGDGKRTDRRTAALLQHLVRGWITVGGFAAQQALEQIALGDADSDVPDLDSGELLGDFDRIWRLLSDGTVANKLATLAPRRLAAPDYRGTNRPRHYWPLDTADVVGGGPLAAQADCGPRGACSMDARTLDAAQVDLSGDLSVAIELDSFRAAAYETRFADSVKLYGFRPLVVSPWINVSEYLSHSHRDKNFKRVGTEITAVNYWTDSWLTCRQYCLNRPECRSWSLDPPTPSNSNGKCHMFTDLGTRQPASGWYSSGLTAYDLEWHPYGQELADFRPMVDSTTMGGEPISSTADVYSIQCYELCFDNPSCQAFRWDKRMVPSTSQLGTCHQLSAVGPTSYSQYSKAGTMPVRQLRIGHLNANNVYEKSADIELPRVAGNQRLLISRTAGEYHVYSNGQRVLPGFSLGTLPVKRGLPERIWVGRRNDRLTRHVAIWDTALDGWEALAIQYRAGQAQTNYVVRTMNGLPEATTTKDREQRTELAVTMLEALVPQLRLLGGYLEHVQGNVYSECVAGQSTAVRDAVQARFGDTLRTATFVEELAGRMHERSWQIECDVDSQCPTGSTCGIRWFKAVDARTAPRTGLMKLCTGLYTPDGLPGEQGVCVPRTGDPAANGGLGGNGSATPGNVGTVKFSFAVQTAGTYALWARTSGQSDAKSFWIRQGTLAWQEWNVPVGRWSEWGWSRPYAALDLTPGLHTFTVAVRDDGTVLRELLLTTVKDTPPDDMREVCYKNGAPLLLSPSTPEQQASQAAWERAQTNLDAAMQAATVQAAGLGECRNPLGIEEDDLPLFFSPWSQPSDPPAALYFAASLFLHTVAEKAITATSGAFSQVETSWNNMMTQKFQQQTLDNANKTRVEQIAARYSDELEDLCGISSNAPGGLLGEFMGNTRDASKCFLVPEGFAGGATCAENFERPISEAAAGCYTGSIGQAILGMKTAHLGIEEARLNWQSKQDQYDGQAKICAYLQDTGGIIDAHIEHMNKLRAKKGLFDKVAGVVALAASVSSGGASLLAVKAAVGALGEGGGWGGVLGEGGKFLGLASGAINLSGLLTAGKEIEEEQTAFENQMAQRKNTTEVMQCFLAADRLRDEINLAAVAIRQATTAFEGATMNFVQRRARVEQLVQEGRAEVQRESERSIGLAYHRYWLDRNIQRYERKLTWARRAAYLYLRAAEYDLQQSLDQRDEILNARNILDLEAAFDKIELKLLDGRFGPRKVPPNARVLRLGVRKILGLSQSDSTTIGQYLSSPASLIYDQYGRLQGRGFRFELTPTSAFLKGDPETSQVPYDCAEHITQVVGSVQITEPAGHPYIFFELWQSNGFASQQCVASGHQGSIPLVASSHWPQSNLFEEDTTVLSETQPFTSVVIQNGANYDLSATDPLVSATDLMGRGLFGEYVLLIRNETLDSIDESKVTDVLFRIEYTAGSNGQAPH